MTKILLVGNGLNRVSYNAASWNHLLNNLAGPTKSPHDKKVRELKPFTLWFEEIVRGGAPLPLKKDIAEFLKGGVPNKHHKALMALNFQHILTTNYDYNLEAAYGGNWSSNATARETLFSLFRRQSCGKRHIWHIHGELDNVSSIMLGHIQYSGYIHKIRSFLTSGVTNNAKGRNGRPYLSKFAHQHNDSSVSVESWVDLFLEHDVHIIGFGLDYTENHLWNLITEKQRLKKQGKRKIGMTIFHRCSKEKKETIADEAKMSILSALGVKVVHHVGQTYDDAYDLCIRSFR
jgi:hypothetical protein